MPSAKHSLADEIVTDCISDPIDDVCDTYIIDGGFYVHVLPPRPGYTFKKYVEVLRDSIVFFFDDAKRVDLVFDIYRKNSLKAATLVKRGKGRTRLVAPETKVPGNWDELPLYARAVCPFSVFPFLCPFLCPFRGPIRSRLPFPVTNHSEL